MLDRLVSLLNARAVTLYLWQNLAIAVSFLVGDRIGVWRLGDGSVSLFGYLAVAVVLLVVPLAVVGWVEDVAARRAPRLLPWGPPTRARRVRAGETVVAGHTA